MVQSNGLILVIKGLDAVVHIFKTESLSQNVLLYYNKNFKVSKMCKGVIW